MNRFFRAAFAVACCSVAFAGCGTLSTFHSPKSARAGGDEVRPEIRDVPYQARDGSPRKRVIVLPFVDSGVTRTPAAAQAARDALVRALRATGEFVIVATADFPRDPAQFLKNGEYDLEAMAKLAQNAGLAAVIEGRVVEIKAKRMGDAVGLVRQVRAQMDATVQVRMASAKTGHVILDEMRSATIESSVTRLAERSFSDRYLEEDPKLVEDAVAKAVRTTVPKIAQSLDKLNWEGRVALVKGERLYLNAGRISGIQIGDILKVTDDGEDVYDPESGSLIGKVPGRLKGTVEVISYFGKDGAVAVVHSGSGFKENDAIEIY